MAPRLEPPVSRHPTLQLGPGHPGETYIDVRVSPAHANELRECLKAEGLHVSDVVELSAGGWLEVLAVSLPAALTAGGAITVAITKFFERHQGKKVTFGAQGQVETMDGLSAKDIEQVLRAVAQQQDEINKGWAATLKQFQNTSIADDHTGDP